MELDELDGLGWGAWIRVGRVELGGFVGFVCLFLFVKRRMIFTCLLLCLFEGKGN